MTSADGAGRTGGEVVATRAPDDDEGVVGASLVDAVARALVLLSAGRTPGVLGDDPWPEACRKVLHLHFARMIVRVPGVIAGEDPEEVHAMRVASRRMRAAWRVFGDGFQRASTARYRHDLRGVGRHLGAVRDLDVLLEIRDAYGSRHGSRAGAGLAPLRDAWAAEREAHQETLADLVSSAAFAAFVGEYEAFLGGGESALDVVLATFPGRVRGRMPATAWSAYEEVWVFDEQIDRADLATLHRLRIAGKWLRYTLEFVREALGTDAAGLIEPVTALQDHLGEQHDLHVAATRARAFAGAHPDLGTKETMHIERFVVALGERVEWYGQRFPRAWRPLVEPAYRARLGRALARL